MFFLLLHSHELPKLFCDLLSSHFGVSFPSNYSLTIRVFISTELLTITRQTTASRRLTVCSPKPEMWMMNSKLPPQKNVHSVFVPTVANEPPPIRRYQFLQPTKKRILYLFRLLMDIIESNREKRTLRYNYVRKRLKIRFFFRIGNVFKVCSGMNCMGAWEFLESIRRFVRMSWPNLKLRVKLIVR